MAPCVLMIDEVEKALSGVASSGTDRLAASRARLFGTFLTWLNDHDERRVTSSAPATTSRSCRRSSAGRSASTASSSSTCPAAQQKQAIWDIYLELFELDPKQPKPGMTRLDRRRDPVPAAAWRPCWTCRWSAAAQNVVPVAVTAAESVERLRKWASGRCLSADVPGIYASSGNGAGQPRRKVRRDPSTN